MFLFSSPRALRANRCRLGGHLKPQNTDPSHPKPQKTDLSHLKPQVTDLNVRDELALVVTAAVRIQQLL